jgi:pimeloyl-ACP methyl ester carboxylesterase
MKPLSAELSAWKSRGQFLDVDGRPIFVKRSGDERAPALLILHGFPTCSYDFAATIPLLSQKYHVVLHDHPGFGLSDKPADYSYSLTEQAETALEVWRRLGIEKAHLLAHDYGTSVATEILARWHKGNVPIDFTSLTLCNGSVHIELARLTISQRLMRHPVLGPPFVRFSNERFFKSRLRNILGQPDAVSDRELSLLWEAVTHNDGRQRLPQISRYISERTLFWHRWIGALQQWERPAHILWGRKDPIAVEAVAQQLAKDMPHSRVTWLEALGHYPMLEDPRQWSDAALQFLDSVANPGRR